MFCHLCDIIIFLKFVSEFDILILKLCDYDNSHQSKKLFSLRDDSVLDFTVDWASRKN